MSLSNQEKLAIITKYGKNEKDTGRPEVQIALLTETIQRLSSHLLKAKKDMHTKKHLLDLISQRKKMISYLKRVSVERYLFIIKELNLRK